MKPEELAYIKHRLSKAEETVGEAELLLACDYLAGTVNRLYYACFYAVTALLFSEGLSSSKHSGVISLFERHWVRAGKLPGEMGKFYRSMFDRRQQGDYKDFTLFEKTDVARWLEETKTFVERISVHLQENA